MSTFFSFFSSEASHEVNPSLTILNTDIQLPSPACLVSADIFSDWHGTAITTLQSEDLVRITSVDRRRITSRDTRAELRQILRGRIWKRTFYRCSGVIIKKKLGPRVLDHSRFRLTTWNQSTRANKPRL